MSVNWISGYIRFDRGEFDLAEQAFQAFADYAERIAAAGKPWPAVVRGLFLGVRRFRRGRTREAERPGSTRSGPYCRIWIRTSERSGPWTSS